MKEISREESRKIMLSILKDIAQFCDTNDIKYFLSSGTLIGAIRHQGYIPWDDDIDIEMPRPDYDRFIELYKANGNYAICTPSEPGSFFVYTKVYDKRTLKIESGIDYTRFKPLGIDVDIFPIDGQPPAHQNVLFRKQVDRRVTYFSFFTSCICAAENKKFKSRIKIFVSRLIGKAFFYNLYAKSARSYDFNSYSMVGFISPYSKYLNRHRKEVFQDRVKVPFEDGEYWAPIGYDEYLQNLYGDYMQLPPLEQQQTHHRNNIFWKDEK